MSTQQLDKHQINQWQEYGYIILRNFFSIDAISSLNKFLDNLWKERVSKKSIIPCDVFLNSKDEQRVSFHAAPESARFLPHKLNDLYLNYSAIRKLNLDARLCGVIEVLLNGKPLVINSLNLEYGSQQPKHIDTMFMPPRVENKMLASWIALDPVTDSNGPLTLYPGSHKIPPYVFSDGRLKVKRDEIGAFNKYIDVELDKRHISPINFIAEPGDVLVWHAQLVHGGSPIESLQTRRSLVTHYFRRRDMLDRFWRIRKQNAGGYYLKRAHQKFG